MACLLCGVSCHPILEGTPRVHGSLASRLLGVTSMVESSRSCILAAGQEVGVGEVGEGKGRELGGVLQGRGLQAEKQGAGESWFHPSSLLCLLGL